MFELFKSRPKFSITALAVFIFVFLSLAVYVVYISSASDGTTDGPELAIEGEYVPDQILVRFKPGTRGAKQREIANKNNLEQIDEIKQIETKVLRIKDKGRVAEKIKALSKNPNVIYAEPDYIVKTQLIPNDPIYPEQWNHPYSKTPEAWDLVTGSTSITVAVLDTGVYINHPDLIGRLVKGYDFVNNDDDPSDDNLHGTHTTGLVGATGNNAEGVAGIDWKTKIMPVKVLNSSGSGSYYTVAKGLTWAVDSGANVINMSLGGAASSTMESAVKYGATNNVVMVAATGNDGLEVKRYPAAYSEVIAVGAVNKDVKTSFSNYGDHLSVVAPGEKLRTTSIGSETVSYYWYFSGTSAASPQVAGLASLVWSANPKLSAAQVREIIESTARDLGDPGFDIYFGHGHINAEAAVKKAQATTGDGGTTTPPADTTAPTVSISSPASGSAVSGIIDVNVNATDNVSVSKVELLVDSKLYAQTTVSPYLFSLDTTTLTNANHTLVAKAYDSAGNVGTSSTITITVNNTTATPIDTELPTVSITNPKDGSTVSKRVSIQVGATDNVGIAKVEIYINSKLHATLTQAPYTTNWNAGHKSVPKGENIITAIAYDAAGNAASTSIRVVK